MLSNQQDGAKSKISPVLFMTVDGEPMSFLLRPGPVKRQLQPLITAGGGMVCDVRKPGTIILLDPEERACLSETTAQCYISTQYIHDCIEKGEQLTIEDYRLDPEVKTTNSAKQSNSKQRSVASVEAKFGYSYEEYAAIVKSLKERKTEVGGNKLRQEMKKQSVTSYICQPIKCCRIQWAHNLSESEKKETKTHSGRTETVKADSTGTAVTKSTITPETEDLPEDLPSSQPESVLERPSEKVRKQNAPPKVAEANPPIQRKTHRQLQLEMPPPNSKIFRSSLTPMKSSLKCANKTKHSVWSAHQKDATVDQPLMKKARGNGRAEVVAIQQEENDTSKTEQPGDASSSGTAKGEKKKEKRKLGILEMATKEFEDDSEDEAKSKIFMTVDGEPMSFLLRPGPVKRQLQPLITAGGGMVCDVRKPGTIILLDPEERACLPETTAQCYISTQYIHDCIEKGEQLTIEDYRLDPEVKTTNSAKQSNSKQRSVASEEAKFGYSYEEYAAIVKSLKEHKTEVGGNKLRQEMKKQSVTSYICQPIKCCRIQWAHNLSESEKKELKFFCSEGAEIVQTDSTDTEVTKSTITPETEDLPEDLPSSQPESVLERPSEKVRKQNAPPKVAEAHPPIQRITHRQLQLEMPPPNSKIFRSSLTPMKSSLKCANKTKHSVWSAHQKDATVDQPLMKKARGNGRAEVVAIQQEENDTSKTEQPGDASSSGTAKGEKKKEKRKLGWLEMATKEFEDDSEDDEYESPDVQNKTETVVMPSTSTSDPFAGVPASGLNNKHGSTHEKLAEDTQASIRTHLDNMHISEPAEFQTVASEPAPPEVPTTSKPHLFIFDHESQAQDSESLIVDDVGHPPASQTKLSGDTAPSLTQAQLEEDMQRIRDLMNQTNQDLASVTKALLKTSGDWSAALDLLLEPSSFSGPVWSYSDDKLLYSSDPDHRRILQEKYGKERVAKRRMFLEVAGSR